MTPPLPLFDEKATCRMCGGGGATIAYHDRNDYTLCRRHNAGLGEHVAHMARRCARCGYEWAEAPLGAAQGAVAEDDA